MSSHTRPHLSLIVNSILLYVDDLVITGADLGEIDRVKLQLATSFDMKDLVDLHYFLGIKVIRTPEGILITQRHYVLSMLFKFGMADCKSVSNPLDRTGKVCDPTRFRQIVRSLIYLTITRTNLSYPSFHGVTHRGAPSMCATRTSVRKQLIHVWIRVLSRECRDRVEQGEAANSCVVEHRS